MARPARDLPNPMAPPVDGRGRPPVVERIRARFRQRLGWRLTASYALVTAATLAVVEAIVFVAGVIWAIVVIGGNGDAITGDLRDRAVPAVVPFLASPHADLAGIDRWLRQVQATGLVAEEDDPSPELRPDASAFSRPETRLLVVGRDGNLVGALKQISVPTALAQPAYPDLPHLAEAVGSALAGDETATPLTVWWPHPDRLTVAVPARDAQGAVVGAVVFTARNPLDASVDVLGGFLGVIAVGILLLGAVIATISGYLAARSLVVRLDRMSTAAAAWGTGDLTAAVADGAEDEIGQLGRRLDRMAEQLADLIRARQQLSVVDERNRLARDLHDSVKQQAFAVSLHLGTARELLERDPAGARLRLDAAYAIARQSQQELTAIISTLRPTELATTLDQALDRYVAEWRAQTGIAVTADLAPSVTLPQEVEDALFRVVQEALTNVARHSRATRATVTLDRDGDSVSLVVADDGTGFDPRRGRTGVGLHSMRERVEAVGGRFAVTSGPDGTRLTVRLDPDPNPNPNEET